MATKIAHLNIDGDLKKVLMDIVSDITNVRTTVAAVRVDANAIHAAATTLATKLNADAGVTDTNYAAPAALTSAALAAVNTANT